MSRFSQGTDEYYRARIRGVLITQPSAKASDIQEALGSSVSPITVSDDYIAKVRNEIMEDRARRVETANMTLRIAEIQDKHELISAKLWEIANDYQNHAMVRVAALKQLSASELALLQAEKDAGVLEDKPGDVRPRKPMSTENRLRVIANMQRWGIVQPYTESEQAEIDQGKIPSSWPFLAA